MPRACWPRAGASSGPNPDRCAGSAVACAWPALSATGGGAAWGAAWGASTRCACSGAPPGRRCGAVVAAFGPAAADRDGTGPSDARAGRNAAKRPSWDCRAPAGPSPPASAPPGSAPPASARLAWAGPATSGASAPSATASLAVWVKDRVGMAPAALVAPGPDTAPVDCRPAQGLPAAALAAEVGCACSAWDSAASKPVDRSAWPAPVVAPEIGVRVLPGGSGRIRAAESTIAAGTASRRPARKPCCAAAQSPRAAEFAGRKQLRAA